jgi:hypothetical protein
MGFNSKKHERGCAQKLPKVDQGANPARPEASYAE